jgi:hypothetical protein
MFKTGITQSLAAAAIVALVASVAFLAPPLLKAKADSQASDPLYQLPLKVDPAVALVRGAPCLSPWPYYELSCQFDHRRPANEARAVRIIATLRHGS